MENFKRPLIEEYEINPQTMAIIPMEYGSKIYSKILEVDEELISPFKPYEIIKKSCQYFGSSYEGRKEGTRELIGITHKAPIVIDTNTSIYFFPTTSPVNIQCIWFAHDHILSHRKDSSNQTIVVFRNKQSLIAPVSYRSFQNQVLRTALLKTKLMQRIRDAEKKSSIYFRAVEWQEEASDKKGSYFISLV